MNDVPSKENPVTPDAPVKEDMSMEQLLSEAEPSGQAGSIVTAHVVEVTPTGVLVDVGLKGEGFIPIGEFRSLPKPPAVGDSFPALIKRMAGPEGHPLVSWKEVREKTNWNKIAQAKAEGRPVEGTVARAIKGGLIVDVGLDAFLPASQTDRRPLKDPAALIGQKIEVMILEMDQSKGGVVVSRRQYLEKVAAEKRESALKSISEGQALKGVVTGVTHFGVFVDVGGVEGLVRLSDVAWGRVEKISSRIRAGQTVDVKVLKIDAATKKISLGMKQLLPHPWDGVERRFPKDKNVKGRVTGLMDFGAFVELEPGVEGLIHQSEFSWKERWAKPKDFLKTGDEVEVRLISVDRANEKISLSLKRAGPNPWEEAVHLYPVRSRVKGTVTHLAPFGAFVRLPIGVEALLRTEDLSWTKTTHNPKDMVSPGQELELVVLEVNPSAEKISVGLKQLAPDPFEAFKTGAKVEGKVTRLTDAGAFVEIAPEIEGFVHVSEIPSDHRLERAAEALAVGQEVAAVVLNAQRKPRRIDLSIRKYEKQQERHLLKQYRAKGEGLTLGEMTDWGKTDEDPSSV